MSRHGKIADDSTRMTVVFPKCIREDLVKIAVTRLVRVSDLIREYVFLGLERDKVRHACSG